MGVAHQRQPRRSRQISDRASRLGAHLVYASEGATAISWPGGALVAARCLIRTRRPLGIICELEVLLDWLCALIQLQFEVVVIQASKAPSLPPGNARSRAGAEAWAGAERQERLLIGRLALLVACTATVRVRSRRPPPVSRGRLTDCEDQAGRRRGCGCRSTVGVGQRLDDESICDGLQAHRLAQRGLARGQPRYGLAIAWQRLVAEHLVRLLRAPGLKVGALGEDPARPGGGRAAVVSSPATSSVNTLPMISSSVKVPSSPLGGEHRLQEVLRSANSSGRSLDALAGLCDEPGDSAVDLAQRALQPPVRRKTRSTASRGSDSRGGSSAS